MANLIKIIQLYPKELNVYGDNGNLLVLKRRLEWRGFKVKIIKHQVGDKLTTKPDIIVSGGGQDSNQEKIKDDLIANAPKLKRWIEQDTPTLLICGSYQLFGNFYQTGDGQKITGAKILDLHTIAGKQRFIGNTIINSKKFGLIAAYENHSGLTYLSKKMKPLGLIVKGAGNNNQNGTEGVLYKNLIGTYAHGPILAKNPKIADFLIKAALKNKNLPTKLKKLDDSLELAAQNQAKNRPR